MKYDLVRSLSLIACLNFVACPPPSTNATDPDVGSDSGSETGPRDITNAVFTVRVPDCAAYAREYRAQVQDVQRSKQFDALFEVSIEDDGCRFVSNSIPNHDFNAAPARFANQVAEVDASVRVTIAPIAAAQITQLTLRYDNALFLNGVKLDLLAAACYGVGNAPLGQEKIGCGDADQPWRYDPMHAANDFGTDSHNAHTQPDGQYHYHGSPNAMFDDADPSVASPAIGFAADGFPIYGPYVEVDGSIRKVVSGYTLRAGDRVSQTGEGAFPGGQYDGTFRDDFVFTGAGDLDECNGMTRDGTYGYYVTDSYPWVLACFKGTPDPSFQKTR